MNDVAQRTRRAWIACAAALALCAAGGTWAQAYPAKPIKLIVAFGTGSANDIIARELARYMGDFLGQSVVVENRTGGGGSWNSLFAPAQTPPEVIDKLNAALNRALALPGGARTSGPGRTSEVLGPTTPQQADAHGQAERARWVPFVRALRIDVE